MSDEWTWEDRQDSLDYRQWKAEQDAEQASMRDEPVILSRAKYAAMVAEIEARKAIADMHRMSMQEWGIERSMLIARIAELEASQESLLASAYERHLQIVALSEHNDPYYFCASCGWNGPRSQLIWSVPRRFICPECKSDKTHRSNNETTRGTQS